jgi:hypothetical protein
MITRTMSNSGKPMEPNPGIVSSLVNDSVRYYTTNGPREQGPTEA